MTTFFHIWSALFFWWLQRQPLAIQRRTFETALRMSGFSKKQAFDVAKNIRPLSERSNQSPRASNDAHSPGKHSD